MSTTIHPRFRVLLVEDSPIDTQRLSPDFAKPGAEFDVSAVKSFGEVIHALKSVPIDAVLLDLFLEGEGADTLSLVREAAPDVPIVALTRLGDEEQAARAVKHGAEDYPIKGIVDNSALFRVIRYAIERKHAETQLRLLEQRLLEGYKLEAVGTLAAGVAHNFNNALTIIMGHSELMLEQAEGERQRKHIDAIKKAAERSALLVRQLLTFSRRQPVAAAFNTLNEILLGMQRSLESTLDGAIELQLKLASNPPAVKVDSNQIEQIVMNLVMNARDAMPHGGIVIIETGVVGERVLLTVTDTGCGMSPETCSHVFEPFFTTKGLAQASGLGLSTVYGIVLQHGGNVQVASEPGRGTTFSIYFPAFHWTEGKSRASQNSAPHRLATILVVEGDQSVRKFLLRVLGETRRYTLLDAGDWPQALELAAAHQGPIDLLIANPVISRLMLNPARGRQDMKAIDITLDLSKSPALAEESVLQSVQEALIPEAPSWLSRELLTSTP